MQKFHPHSHLTERLTLTFELLCPAKPEKQQKAFSIRLSLCHPGAPCHASSTTRCAHGSSLPLAGVPRLRPLSVRPRSIEVERRSKQSSLTAGKKFEARMEFLRNTPFQRPVGDMAFHPRCSIGWKDEAEQERRYLINNSA